MAEGFARNWDDEVENPDEGGEFITLDPGVYEFECTKFEREKWKGSAKIPAGTWVAVLTFDVAGATIRHKFFLWSTCDGINAQFLISAGLRKHGDVLKMNFQDAVGCTGWCKVTNRAGQGKYDGKVFNEIDRFLEHAPEDPPRQQAATPAPQQQQAEIPGTEEEDIPF